MNEANAESALQMLRFAFFLLFFFCEETKMNEAFRKLIFFLLVCFLRPKLDLCFLHLRRAPMLPLPRRIDASDPPLPPPYPPLPPPTSFVFFLLREARDEGARLQKRLGNSEQRLMRAQQQLREQEAARMASQVSPPPKKTALPPHPPTYPNPPPSPNPLPTPPYPPLQPPPLTPFDPPPP